MTEKSNKFSKKAYFPTLVFQIDLADPKALNEHLLKTIYAERDKDREGIARSNFKELGGWHSHNNLHKNAAYSELVNQITTSSARVSKELGYNKDYKLDIGTMWSIINPPGSANRAHVHPGCLWSGVYYIQAPENAGSIEFVEPRTVHLMNQARYIPNQKRPQDCWTKVRFAPTAGRMLIFPSWLYHAVDPNLSKEPGDAANRIIVSFNLNQKKK
jgi:uncharacterized protein (TIGR02466 family)